MTDTEKIKLITKMLDDCWGCAPEDEGEFLLGVLTCVDTVARFGGADNDE